MYFLGTETDRLFRTRSAGDCWINDFGRELRSMTSSVRAVYGLLAYDTHYSTIMDADELQANIRTADRNYDIRNKPAAEVARAQYGCHERRRDTTAAEFEVREWTDRGRRDRMRRHPLLGSCWSGREKGIPGP